MARIKPTHLIAGVLGIAIVAGTFLVVLPEVASYGSLIDQFQRLTSRQLIVLVGFTVLNVLTFVPLLQAASRLRRGALAHRPRRGHGSPSLLPAGTAPATG